MGKITSLLFAIVLLAGCDIDKCEDRYCATGPPFFAFEIADKDTGENLFTKGTFNEDDISLRNEEGKNIPYQLAEDDLNIIQTPLEIEAALKSYFLKIGSTLGIEIKYSVVPKTEDCCSFYDVLEFSVLDYETEHSNTTGIITVFVGE